MQCLIEQLNEHGVVYCLWKGTFNARRAANAEKDIDLLVSQSDAATLVRIASQLGFKQAHGPAAEEMPGTTNYFAYDQEADSIIHVHVHQQIVLGHPLKAIWHLPIEKAYLAQSERQSLFSTPQPEIEFILFCLRMVLQKAFKLPYQSRVFLSSDRQREYEYLHEKVDQSLVEVVLRQHLPCVKPELFHQCSDALAAGDLPGAQLQHRLRTKLDHFRLRLGWVGRLKTLWHRACRAVRIRMLRRPLRKQRIDSGGVMIAVVGGDGAGKSTVVEHLRAWLAKHFDVRTVHLGKPRRSLITQVIRSGLKIGRGIGRLFKSFRRETKAAAPSYSKLMWNFCVARDRHHTYHRARRYAAEGQIVICDRWPIPDVMSMDGPQIRRSVGKQPASRLVNWLAGCEERWYRAIAEPDCLIVLKVAPEIAHQRKTEEDSEFVRSRAHEVWNAPWSETNALVVDALQPIDLVLSQVKEHVWEAI